MTAPLELAELPTPVGPLAVMTDDGVVVASGFGTVDALLARLGTPDRPTRRRADLGAVSRAVAAYTSGDLDALDAVTVRQPGTPLLQHVWVTLRGVPAGRTVAYRELAARADRPAAVRFAASACARNLVAPFVPCHRVVRSDGSLGGYYYGPEIKAALLAHEGAAATRTRS